MDWKNAMLKVGYGLEPSHLTIKPEFQEILWRGAMNARNYWATDPCVYCGLVKRTMSEEHIQPVIGGGKGGWRNKASACTLCNSRRSSYPLIFWLVARRRAGNCSVNASRWAALIWKETLPWMRKW